jgi:hypothetical protein
MKFEYDENKSLINKENMVLISLMHKIYGKIRTHLLFRQILLVTKQDMP